MATQQTARTQYITIPNGSVVAYRLLGPSHGIPLLMHIHYRANMDFWDPLLVNHLAQKRPVILFDQPGVGRSTGSIPPTYQGWADNVVALVTALNLTAIDLLGFSMGGYTATMAALTAPSLIRKLILAGTGPSVPSGPHPGIVWPRDIAPPTPFHLLSTSNTPSSDREALTTSFFPPTPTGHRAAHAYFSRIASRTSSTATDHEPPFHTLLDLPSTGAQHLAVKEWNVYNPRNSFARLSELCMPVLVLNGDADLLIPTSRSWELLQGIPNAQLIIYPRAGHGFIWQYAERVATDVQVFLDQDLGGEDAGQEEIGKL